ncbi:MAG: dihydrodipicolinate synthase family protein [Gemmatimonadota bacterium]|nr:dihydrodipicolinate synthase family protein [Gemmatimonadota bacterium]
MAVPDPSGVYTIAPTPFEEDGSLDTGSLSTLTNFLIDLGIDGITVLGVLGETSKLVEAERDLVIGGVVEAAAGRIPVCAGTSHTGTDGCVALSRRAEELGASSLMVAPPKLARGTDEALLAHYLKVADAVSIPLVIQDHPTSSGVQMSIEFIATVADRSPQCRFLKLEEEPTPRKASQVLAANPDVEIFGGLGGVMLLEELRHGCMGTMTGFAYPDILKDIHTKYKSGDIDGATETFYRYCPLIRFEAQTGIGLSIRKNVYQRRGAIKTARARQPYVPLDDGTLADLNDLLTRLGLE